MNLRRRGFSLIEALVVLTILGVLVRIAIPRYGYVRKQAVARAAVADVRVLRDAALNFHQDRGVWPSESGPGQVPAGLAAYLPAGFSLQRGAYELDFESWGTGGAPSPGGNVIGVAIDTPDPELALELRRLGASGIPYFVSGARTTFVLDGIAGVS